jgi:hypothetical protein
LKKLLAASRPPAEAPMPTTGKRRETSIARSEASLLLEGDFLAGILLLQMLCPTSSATFLWLREYSSFAGATAESHR